MPDEARLLHDDIAARENALDITRSFIVQAPAGSGKTELLIQRYLRLLATVADPEEIIAITFTRKAAAEMQFRVLEALRKARAGELPDEPHEQRTFRLATAALQRDRERGWNLLANPRRLRIQTMDSLNASIARSRPISEPGNASGVRVVTDAELTALHRQAAVATLDYVTTTGPLRDAVTAVLAHLDNNTAIYVDYLAHMLRTRDQWLPFTGSGNMSPAEAAGLRRTLESHLETAIRKHLELTASLLPRDAGHELAALLDYAAGNVAGGGAGDSPIASLAGLTQLPPTEPGAVHAWQGIADLLLTQKGEFRKQVDKRSGFPPEGKEQKQAIRELLVNLAGHEQLAEVLHGVRQLPPAQYTDEQWSVLLALFRLLPLASIELQRQFAEHALVDHIDVAMTAGNALGTADSPGDVALLLDYQVSHVLIDEMQDTSHAQYRMLEALTGGWQPDDGRTLFCVGDPMQSIYRFRNAEVGQFLLARQHGLGELRLVPLVLRRNFRSGGHLVDWFNRVFPDILAERDDAASGAVSYSGAVKVDRLADIGAWHVHPVFGSDRNQEAQTGCRVLLETLHANPDDTVAVLVRGRNQLPRLLGELRKAGIAYRAIEIDKLTDLPEIIEVLALTRAAVHPADRVAWLGLLRAPWVGLDWSDLHALVADARHSTVPELLQDPARVDRLSAYGREAVVSARPILDRLAAPRRSGSLRDLVEECWLGLGGAALLGNAFAVDNVYRYLDVLEQHEQHGSLDDVATLEALLDEERVSTSSDARLQVMTMHKAKGLEFDHVVLFGLGRLPGRSGRSVLSWLDIPDEHGTERKIISPVGSRTEIDKDPVHRYIELAQAAKDRHEQARLLYVACTRARKSLHLIGHTVASPDGFRPPARNSLLAMLWPAVEGDFSAAFDAGKIAGDEEDVAFLQPVRRRFGAPWSPPAVSPLPEGVRRAEDAGPDEQEREFYWVGTEARIAGTIVHRWLQVLADGKLDGDPTDLALRDDLTRRWLREIGIAEPQHERIATRVSAALDGVLEDARGRWVLDGAGHAELALTGIYDGRVESVVLDRVRIDEAGRHWIIDYKTSSHEGGNLQGFLEAELDRYTPQLRKYADIYAAFSGEQPHCALYFPLLQEFIEVQ